MSGRIISPRGKEKAAHCHKLVADVAWSMAHETFDELMKDNVWWDRWKLRWPGYSTKQLENIFVRRAWPEQIEPARATLAGMLGQPIDEELKIQIHEALCLDATLTRGRKRN